MHLGTLARIAVIDDDESGRGDLMDELREYDFDPLAIIGPFGRDVDRLISEIERHNPDFVICDHKLQPRGLASFYGLEVVKRLINARRPAMLLTMFQSSDRLALREARYAVPVIMGRDAFQPTAVRDYANVCIREIAHDPVDERKPHRVLLRIDYVDPSSSSNQFEAIIPSWSPDHAVAIPETCIDPNIIRRIASGTYLLGEVNIGARSEDDLFFRNINEIAAPAQSNAFP